MESLPQKLLGYPPIKESESFPSFLFRLGKANFYQSPTILTNCILNGIGEEDLLKDHIDLPMQAATFERIARLARVECFPLYETSAHRFAQVITAPDSQMSLLDLPDNHVVPLLSERIAQKQLRPTSASQYCPLCVQRHRYHRLIWHATATSVCLEHKCLLTNRCYSCSRLISIGDIVNGYCRKCGVALNKAPCISIEEDEIGMLAQQVIQGWLLDTSVSLPDSYGLPSHPSRVVFRVLEGLRLTTQRLARSGWMNFHTVPAHHDTLMVPFKPDSLSLTPYQSFCVYTTAFKALTHWPQEFYAFLDVQYEQHCKDMRRSTLQKDFGSIYSHWLQREWRYATFDFVQDAFNLYIADRYGISPSILRSDRFHRSPAALRKFSFVSINYAAELAGVTPATIHRLIDSGQLETTQDSVFVKREEVLRLRETWNFFVGLKEATETLGVSEEVVLRIVDIHLLSPEQSPHTGFTSWKFHEKNLCRLLENIKKHAIPYERLEGVRPSLNIAGAARILTQVGLNAASILALVANGKLPAYRQSSLRFCCKDLLFVTKDLRAYMKTTLVERGWLSRQEVIARLEVKDGTLAKWVKTGLLATAAIYVNAQYFEKDAVEKFVAEYVKSKEAANTLGIGVLAVQKWARQGRLQAVSGPGIDEHHEYLFSKEYLLQWHGGRLPFGRAKAILGVSAATLHRWVHEGKVVPLDDMGGKQRWFSRAAILKLRQEIEQKFAVTSTSSSATCSISSS